MPRDRRLLILLYHGVRPRQDVDSIDVPGKHVPELAFAEQMRFVRRHYRAVSLSDAVKELTECPTFDSDLACVTFDDGYENNATVAAPILRSLGIPATYFVTTGFIGGQAPLWVDRLERAMLQLPGPRQVVTVGTARLDLPLGDHRERTVADGRLRSALKGVSTRQREAVVAELERRGNGAGAPEDPLHRPMSWDQVRGLVASGFEIGAHTVTHPILMRSPREEAEAEILDSRRVIEAQCGIACRHFALPNGRPGDFDAGLLQFVRDAGFASCATTIEGFADPVEGPFHLRRVSVDTSNRWVFRAAALGWRPRLRAARDRLRRWI